MEIPLEKEILQILSNLGIPVLNVNHPIHDELFRCSSKLRSHLLKIATTQARHALSQSSFWDITPKYRLDVLRFDIVKIANQLAYAIGFSTLYLSQVAKSKTTYFPTMADSFFWYHIDFGIRLASSGWDRIALLLDLAYQLNLDTKCNFPRVVREIPKVDRNIVHNTDFKKLRDFRNNRFLDLEAGAGRGARHETTHLLSASTKFFSEFLENRGKAVRIPPDLRPKERRDMLIEHHEFYLSGIQSALQLVSLRWP